MKNKPIIIAIIVVVVGISAAAAWMWRPSNTPNAPEGTLWLCQKDGNTFRVALTDLAENYKSRGGQAMACPQCNETNTVRAAICVTCQKPYRAVLREDKCPTCRPASKKGPRPPFAPPNPQQRAPSAPK